MIFDRYPEYRDKCGRYFWARGYYAETIGQVNEDTIKKYIEEQEECLLYHLLFFSVFCLPFFSALL